jgi:hypothetical protein
VPERRAGVRHRPWLRLDRTTPRLEEANSTQRCGHNDADALDVRLPPERPFVGDAIDTLDAIRQNAVARERRRRRARRIGIVTVVGLALSAGYDLAEHFVEAL